MGIKVDFRMQIRSSALSLKAICSLILLTSCQAANVDNSKQDIAEAKPQTSAEANAKTQIAEQRNTTVASDSGTSKPFIAVFKKQEPVPDALSTGLLEISNNCLVVKINSQSGKLYTAVLPNNYKFISNSLKEKFVKIGNRTITLDIETSIPGGIIFVDVDEYIQNKIPASCPSGLFGIGE
jgi:hypothetical protein